MPILDTDILISFLRNKKKAVQEIKKLIESESNLKTTIINVGELYTGAYLSSQIAKDINAIEKLLRKFDIIEFSNEDARIFGQIQANLINTGNKIGKMDMLIGSIALNHSETLYTRNVKHFSKIPLLKIKNWFLD
ncbi:MAG: type II toxin-antitoxin system VapC family toxin [Candidatus Lokiarchaeota archaeon]|nr:type II toxin-antitoxin system VapC family toxin [Candidatus Harpocratesius repetitus]